MELTILIITAIGLSADCFAISVIYGSQSIKNKFYLGIRLSLIFGLFHVLMPYIGYSAGSSVREYIEFIDHWVSFILLAYIGIKMIIDDRNALKKKEMKEYNMKFKTMVYLSFATSIDALAVGISFSLIDLPIYQTITIIGLTAFLFSFLGVGFGDLITQKINLRVQLIGGIILIGIGTKILIEHLYLHYMI